MNVLKMVGGFFGGLSIFLFGSLIALAFVALKICLIVFVVYFALAALGVLPPVDVLPFIPYV